MKFVSIPYMPASKKDPKIYNALYEGKLEERYGLVYKRTYYTEDEEKRYLVYHTVFKVTNEKRFLLAALRENITFKEEE